jgi:hypothetical protein
MMQNRTVFCEILDAREELFIDGSRVIALDAGKLAA